MIALKNVPMWSNYLDVIKHNELYIGVRGSQIFIDISPDITIRHVLLEFKYQCLRAYR